MHANGVASGTEPDLAGYRGAVADLLLEIASHTGPGDLPKAERVLTERLASPEFAAVLAASPEGCPAAVDRLLREVRHYQPGARNCAADLVAHIRIHLFALIDVMWWGSTRAFVQDCDLTDAADLVDLEPLRRRGELHFRYRRQARTLPLRAVRAVDRRLWPDRIPRTAGLRFALARPQVVNLLNRLAADFAAAAPAAPPLWVTSLARSIEQQRRLRALGYTATLPSAHCVGYAVDIEMSWFRRFGAAATLEGLLAERQQAGEVNAIDEGQTWHLCLSPAAAGPTPGPDAVCGIALILGPRPDRQAFGQMLATLAPRGEVEEILATERLLAGTQRLRIVDADRAIQPFTSADGRWVLCYNGEVFNYRLLQAELTRRGHRLRTDSDTEVVLESFLEWGTGAVTQLRGEFAFALADTAADRVYLARDPLGVKPLYWSRPDGGLHVASEIKALTGLGAPVSEVPPGHHGWAESAAPVLHPYVDLLRLGDDQPAIEDPDEAAKLVRAALEDSIRVRVDTGLTVGVILSGGLDSSLALLHVREMHPDCVAFTIGAPASEDLAYARRLTADLGVPHEVIEVRPRDIRLADIREAIRVGELTEYGDIINEVVSVPLFRRIHELGVKVVLSGDGSDELFGGYPMYFRAGPEQARRLFQHKIRNLCRTELQRLDRASMGHGTELRVPFLDLSLVELAMRLPRAFKQRDGQDKWILREAFADVLPGYIRRRPKDMMSYSSGLHERARLFKPLFPRLYSSFGYGLLEPMRRDFDTVLERSGHDLDRAIADGAARPDYTLAERARDLAGAARWNAVLAVRERRAELGLALTHRAR